MTVHVRFHEADGMTALGICESLLLTLTELKIISDKDARDLLTDVATTHAETATTSPQRPNMRQSLRLCSASSWARTACGTSRGTVCLLNRGIFAGMAMV